MKRKNVLRNTQGFTLVELAIVLVIIGLIIGGVLKGRELITNSKAKNVSIQMQAMPGAAGLYKDKHPTFGFPNLTSLQNRGFLTGTGGMKNKFGGDVFIVPASGSAPAAVISTNVPGEIAQMVDDQLDNGIPNSGALRVYSDVTPPSPTASPLVGPSTVILTAAAVQSNSATTLVLDFN